MNEEFELSEANRKKTRLSDDSHTLLLLRRETHGGQFVEACEELVEQLDQLLSAAGRGQLGEAHDVCEQDTDKRKKRTFLFCQRL